MSTMPQAVLQYSAPTTGTLAPTSRYFSVGTQSIVTPSGGTIVYFLRRFVPPPERFVPLHIYTVQQGDRLDNITAQFLNDPEQFWRVCDANRALRPDDLTAVLGAKLRITLPEGIPGATSA
jgi:hypothetical protein